MIDYRKLAPDMFEFSVRGSISKADIDGIWSRFEPDVPKQGKVRVLEIIEPVEGMAPSAIWEDFRRGWPFIGRVNRAAIVTDQRWVSAFVNVAKVFMPGEMKVFPMADIDAARRWLEH